MPTESPKSEQPAQETPSPEEMQVYVGELQSQRTALLDQLTAANTTIKIMDRKLHTAATKILELETALAKFSDKKEGPSVAKAVAPKKK